jgi:hypothetical protein
MDYSDIPKEVSGDDIECCKLFAIHHLIYGRGETQEEAIDDLECMLQRGSHIPKKIVTEEDTENEEDENMKPTSVWKIENVEDIWITQDVEGISLMLKNRDDLYKIMMTGDAIDNFNNTFVIAIKKEIEELKAKSKEISNDNALLLATNKKLEEINKNLKKHVQYHIDDKDNIIKRKDELSKENYELKKRYDCLNRKFNRVILNRMSPMIENFADEEPVDNVNHPSHYTGKYECINVMQDVFGDEATNDFCLCNAFKYIWRARKKNGLEDVKKAVWYLNKYIEEAEKDGQDKSIRRT